MIKDKRIIVILCFVFFIGCSSDEYKQAEQKYVQAKSSHDIDQLVTSLTVLARLAPEEYSPVLIKAKQAKIKLLESQSYIEQKNYYLAYLSSHDSLNSMYSLESKKILIKSGSVLFLLLKAKKNIDKSYQHSLLTFESLSHYKELTPLDWDLIELNALLKKFTKNILSLEASISIMKAINTPTINSLSSELLLVQLSIENQLQRYKTAQNYLIDIALYHNATLLITLNNKLSEESFTISQVFNKSRITKAMRPFIDRSKDKYASSKNIIENIYFSSSSKTKNRHSEWFNKWQRLEKDIFDPIDGFVDYSLNAKYRNERLMAYVKENKIQLPTEKNNIINSTGFFQESKTISSLIEKLTKNSRFFNS
jgi:hypothetical protein